MRFRRRLFRAKKFPREPLNWDRISYTEQVDTSAVYSAVVQITLFDPTTVTVGNQDLRLTIRRIRFAFDFQVVFAGGGNIQQRAFFGIYVARQGEPSRDPSFTSATSDQRTDWMWRSSQPFHPAGATDQFWIASTQNVLDNEDQPSVRANRKLDEEELVVMTARILRSDPSRDGAPTVSRQTLSVSSSNLYQRTMRR